MGTGVVRPGEVLFSEVSGTYFGERYVIKDLWCVKELTFIGRTEQRSG